MSKAIKIQNWISGYMTRVDGPPNVINAGVNGLGTPVQFEFKPGATEAYELHRLLISGLGGTNITSPAYVNLTLPAGDIGTLIELHNDNGLVSSITGLQPIKSNDEWSELCYDVRQNLFGANPKSISGRYTFNKDTGGSGILLDGAKGEKLIVTIQADLSTLVSHHFRVGAKKVDL